MLEFEIHMHRKPSTSWTGLKKEKKKKSVFSHRIPLRSKNENVNLFYIRFRDIFWNVQFHKSQHSHLHKTQELKKKKANSDLPKCQCQFEIPLRLKKHFFAMDTEKI